MNLTQIIKHIEAQVKEAYLMKTYQFVTIEEHIEHIENIFLCDDDVIDLKDSFVGIDDVSVIENMRADAMLEVIENVKSRHQEVLTALDNFSKTHPITNR